MNRRLYRCRDNRRLAGVAAGVAEFFGLDPTLVRVLWFISIFFGGFSIVLYIGLALVIPLEPLSPEAAAAEAAAVAAGPEGHRHAAGSSTGSGRWTTVLGIVLMLFGAVALLDLALPGTHTWRYFWPVVILGIGTVLVIGALRRERTEL